MKVLRDKRIMLALLIIAGLFITDGLYLKTKALLAQHLLKRAWEESLATNSPVKPWPWADSWPVARLKVERLGVDCIVLEGESGEVLAFAPGHLSNSAEPLAKGNCALVGHNDTSFGFLKSLEKGDIIRLQNIQEEEKNYEVVSTIVKNREDLFLEETVTPWLTLITCYPFSPLSRENDQRFVVFAKEMQLGEYTKHGDFIAGINNPSTRIF